MSKKRLKQINNCGKKLRVILVEYNSSRDLLEGEKKLSVKEIHFDNIKNDGFAEIICELRPNRR